MHCNKHIKSDDGLFESLGYPSLLVGYIHVSHSNSVTCDQMLLFFIFPSSPCSRKRLIEVKGVYDHSQKPCKVYQ